MKNKIYRSVSVEDRLPKTEGRYLVFNHGQWHESNYCEQYSFHEEMTNCAGITHWMETVDLPTEEAIRQFANELSQDDVYTTEQEIESYVDGASFILNHIKGGE